jgi:putative molybdopterin biosynthesis protein
MADEADLKFIKVAVEEYDFLVQKDLLEIDEIKALLGCLTSGEFAERLPAGIFVYERTGEIGYEL